MKVYVILRDGVYRHECLGVFTSEPRAKAQALAYARQEPDGHHSIIVLPFETDQVAVQEDPSWRGSYKEPQEIFRTDKRHANEQAVSLQAAAEPQEE